MLLKQQQHVLHTTKQIIVNLPKIPDYKLYQ
jgi:hypothetical protein